IGGHDTNLKLNFEQLCPLSLSLTRSLMLPSLRPSFPPSYSHFLMLYFLSLCSHVLYFMVCMYVL
ncbi:hypothetical protein BDQ17DRAFT_1372421, partial [Cyathus striatus]